MVQFSIEILDSLTAPKLSLLSSCGAPDVPELPNYHGLLVLNQALGFGKYKEPAKVLLLNFLRRLRSATEEYRSGRENLEKYVSALPQHELGCCNRALAYFEDCILNANVAITCLSGLGKYLQSLDPSVAPVFKVGDGSDYDSLRLLSNRIKHFDEDVLDAALSGSTSIPVAPVWITNQGLEASNASLSFVELADILTTQARDAKAFAEDFFIKAGTDVEQQRLTAANPFATSPPSA
jgi:hypothetical protein